MSWPLVALGDVAQVIGGSTPRRGVNAFWGEGHFWATPTDLPMPGEGILDLYGTKESITDEGLRSSSTNLLPVGAVLYSTRATIGKLAVAKVPVATNQGFNSFIVGPAIQNQYLAYALQYFTPDIECLAGSTTFKEVSRSKIRAFKIPLPPPSEQRRIVEILDQADALRKLSRDADAKAARILPALFLKMFGDPTTNPMGWPKKPLRAAIEAIEPGWSARSEPRPREPGEFGVLKVSAVTSGTFLSEENKAVTPIPAGKALVIARKGDLLFSRANTRELVAATCIVEEDHPDLFLPDKLWRVTADETAATNVFLKFMLSVEFVRDQIRARASGSSGSMLNVSQQAVLNAVVPLPDVDLQRDFSKQAWQVLELVRATKTAARGLDAAWTSVFSRAFSGQLTAKWRQAHMQELLIEMQEQARLLNLPAPN